MIARRWRKRVKHDILLRDLDGVILNEITRLQVAYRLHSWKRRQDASEASLSLAARRPQVPPPKNPLRAKVAPTDSSPASGATSSTNTSSRTRLVVPAANGFDPLSWFSQTVFVSPESSKRTIGRGDRVSATRYPSSSVALPGTWPLIRLGRRGTRELIQSRGFEFRYVLSAGTAHWDWLVDKERISDWCESYASAHAPSRPSSTGACRNVIRTNETACGPRRPRASCGARARARRASSQGPGQARAATRSSDCSKADACGPIRCCASLNVPDARHI